MNSWYNFYKDRTNNKSYEKYFENKYKPFLNIIKQQLKSNSNNLEVGCGTSLVTKLIYSNKSRYSVLDKDKEIMKLTNINLKYKIVKRILQDIRQPIQNKYDVIYSHGVLEHFSKREIKQIVNNLKNNSKINVHYVPTNKYKIPSFGDELLISKKDWEKLTKPNSIIEFNNGYDLILIWKQ
jgi:cyclopropane fatty-acyl-phospholipid synthase-like methyltransferase